MTGDAFDLLQTDVEVGRGGGVEISGFDEDFCLHGFSGEFEVEMNGRTGVVDLLGG